MDLPLTSLSPPSPGVASAPGAYADSAAPTAGVAARDRRPPGVVDALVGIGGPLALGLCFRPAVHADWVAGSYLVGLLGSLAFTLPTLLVAHQAFGLRGEWVGLANGLAWTAVRAGRVALACVPVAALYVAADQAAPAIWFVLLVAQGALLLVAGARAVAAPQGGDWRAVPFTFAWAGLTGLVGAVLLLAWTQP